MKMATDEKTIKSLERLIKQLENLGVKSPEFTSLKRHIGQQKQQIGWIFKNGKWIYKIKRNNVRKDDRKRGVG
jgi:hypothetical protein